MPGPRPHKILLVDDEDSFRLSLEIRLNMTNQYQVTSCGTGEDAIERMRNESFDVVLLDYRLPGLSGLDVLKWMQDHSMSSPVIILTALDDKSVPLDAMRLGAYDYIHKAHIDFDGLALEIESVYERFLYRSVRDSREKTEFVEQQRVRELESLRTFQASVTSIGQFAETGLAALMRKLEANEATMLAGAEPQQKESLQKLFQELRKDVELVSSGVKSMVDLSTFVSKKLGGIENHRNTE